MSKNELIDEVVNQSDYMNDLKEQVDNLKNSINQLTENIKGTNKESKSFDNIKKETISPAVDKSKADSEDDKTELDHYTRRPNPSRSFRQLANQGTSNMNQSQLGETIEAQPPDIDKLRENFRSNVGHQSWINSDQSEDNKRKTGIEIKPKNNNVDLSKISEQFRNHTIDEDVDPENISYHLR